MSNKNAEQCYMMFNEKIATTTLHHIPRKRIRPTNNPPWFSQEIKASSMYDNSQTEDFNNIEQNPIVKNMSMEKRSSFTNLLDFFGEVYRIYDRKRAVTFIYLDFQKAFDKVPHKRPKTTVEAHGIRSNYSRWIKHWLIGHTQRVMIHDQASDSTHITSGVPQGSVLGPLLFIIYINDLDVGIINKIKKFADDTKLCQRALTERARVTIQSYLNRLLQWTETLQMSFNVDNYSLMHVGAYN
ncbi:Reverse transcriptase domain [Trinorchestia longiramus]|nr:Reverse transcriptase domain [Trinorchestia longiramus]